MLDYIEYLNMPAKAGLMVVTLFFALQLVGEILEVKGKVVPELLKIRKYFARKKQERETFKEMCVTLAEVKKTLDEVKANYSADNIQKRDAWMRCVDNNQARDHAWLEELDKKLDQINADTLELLIEGKRETIISFASRVIDENNPVTREQFNRIFRIHKEYDEILKKNGLTNGEVDIAYRIITEAYGDHMKKHSFVEDIRGYEQHV